MVKKEEQTLPSPSLNGGSSISANQDANEQSNHSLPVGRVRGGSVDLHEVARKVGLGALKYFILKVDARKNMLFNPEESIDFNGNTGPFIQYTYARIASILRKANEQGVVIPKELSTVNCQLSTKETELIQKLSQFPVAVRQAGTDYSPSGICNYCYELTKAFNQFYHDFTILGETDETLKLFRLSLAKAVAKVISLGMGLLGIEMPERM